MTEEAHWTLRREDCTPGKPGEEPFFPVAGVHYHEICCPNDHCVTIESRSDSFRWSEVGALFYCPECERMWATPAT